MITPEEHFQLYQSLEAKREKWNSFWTEIARYVMPRKLDTARLSGSGVNPNDTSPGSSDETFLFDNTAIQSNQTLANGQLSWMTPHEAPWFAFRPPSELAHEEEVKTYFRICTEATQAILAGSNFYSEIHELYLDRGAFGTAVIMCEPGRNSPLTFRNWDVGTYSLDEDDEGEVNMSFRRYARTPLQLAERFGYENLPSCCKEALREARKQFEPFEVIHGIFPRKPDLVDPSSPLPIHMPYASVFQLVKGKEIISESGFREKPFAATRFLRWGADVYGYSPAWMALPEARQLNFLEKQLDALAEVSAFPRVLIPANMEDEIDMTAGGPTYFDPAQPNSVPREWLTGGRYDIGLDRANRKREAIKEAYFVDLFKMFANIDKEMTAREVMERSAEKVTQFSPTFARMTTELFNPLLRRIFALLVRQGAFPPPPDILIQSGFLPDPKIEYSSRIAMAIASVENAALARVLEMVLPVADRRPEILDNFDWDVITRDVSRNSNLPERWIRNVKAIKQIRDDRQKQIAQQQQMEQAAGAAKAARDVGSIPPDSPIAGMLKGAANGRGR